MIWRLGQVKWKMHWSEHFGRRLWRNTAMLNIFVEDRGSRRWLLPFFWLQVLTQKVKFFIIGNLEVVEVSLNLPIELHEGVDALILNLVDELEDARVESGFPNIDHA